MPVFYEGLRGLYRFATWGVEAHHKRVKSTYALSFKAGRRRFGNGETGAADIRPRLREAGPPADEDQLQETPPPPEEGATTPPLPGNERRVGDGTHTETDRVLCAARV